jgi:hypothetical protein
MKKELKEQGSQDNKEGHEECTGAVEVENEKKDHDGGSSQTIRAINAAPDLERNEDDFTAYAKTDTEKIKEACPKQSQDNKGNGNKKAHEFHIYP